MLWLVRQQLKSKSPRIRRQAIQKIRQGAPEVVVPLLVEVLRQDAEPLVRVEAADALATLKDARASAGLQAALKDSSPEVRVAAVDGLKRQGDATAVKALAPLLGNTETQLQGRVAQALKFLGWQPKDPADQAVFHVALGEFDRAALLGRVAVGPLSASLKDTAYQKRVLAVNRLAEIGDPAAVAPLLTALHDMDALVRTAAANALGRLGDRKAVGNLTALLKDRASGVRVAAATALGMLGDPLSVDFLLPLLRDPHWEVRTATLEALGRLRDARAVPAMAGCLKDSDREVREKAAESLGILGDVGGLGPLIETLLDAEASVRQAAARALQRIDPYWERTADAESHRDMLKEAAHSHDYGVQYAARDALRRMGETPDTRPAAVVVSGRKPLAEILAELARDPDVDVRLAAVEATVRLGGATAIALLQPASLDPDPTIAAVAARALANAVPPA